MTTVRRRVLSVHVSSVHIRSVHVRVHPYGSYTRSPSSMINMRDFSTLNVNGPPPPPRLPMAFPEVLPLNSICQPQEHEIDIEGFLRMWPTFNGMPLRYIRDALSNTKGKQMLDNVINTKILQYFNEEEPQECEVSFNGPAYDGNVVPSHILAVHQGEEVRLFPVHQIVFAVNCATLPDFPDSSSSNNSSTQFILPVVKLEVPSLKSFHVLYDYLYTKNMKVLRQTFGPPADVQSMLDLYRQIDFIRDLWKNACALSVVDIGLYILMQDLYREAQNAIRNLERVFL